MLCPRDGSTFETETIHDVPTLKCGQCGGMFLEHGDLNKVAEPTSGDLEFSTIDQDSFSHPDATGPFACPRDTGVTMQKVEFNIGTNIILDYCPECRGFWLDGAELSRINAEVKDLNDAERTVADPPLVRLSNFFWSLPFPR